MTKTRKQQRTMYNSVLPLVAVSTFLLAVLASRGQASPAASGAKRRIFAQVLVESTVAKHAELAGLELATTPPDGHDCTTIAATDVKEMGDKCDTGELAVMKTGKPTVEKEGDGYDVTLPFHVSGKTIGIIGMDFKLDQKESGLVDRANVIAKELEDQIPAKSKLFEAAK
jgi:hypothetical protein